MDEGVPALQRIDPRPISSPSLNKLPSGNLPEVITQPSATSPNLALRLGPDSQIPDHPSSPLVNPQISQKVPARRDLAAKDVRSLRAQCQSNLREYIQLVNVNPGGYGADAQHETRIRTQAARVIGELKSLQSEVRAIAKAAENHRWRKWLLGGVMASFIPLLRRIFRRPSNDEESMQSSNDTEYAFQRSKSLLDHIRGSVLGKGHFATIAAVVFAVLYVFQAEVSLRVAKTVQKRVRRLAAKVERGETSLDERDVKLLEGWRWRIILW